MTRRNPFVVHEVDIDTKLVIAAGRELWENVTQSDGQRDVGIG